jgi:hypothetical protein
MTEAPSARRGHGEDSIYWDASRNRYLGAVDLGFSPAGKRIRKKVSGKTKAEVRDKLKELHKAAGLGKTWVPRELRHTFACSVTGTRSGSLPIKLLLPRSAPFLSTADATFLLKVL